MCTVTTFTIRHYIEISTWNQEGNRFLVLYLLHKFYYFDFELYYEFNKGFLIDRSKT